MVGQSRLINPDQRQVPKNGNMFDLEKSITEWRQQMLTAGIKSPAPLEELESHLREEIARQMKSGLNEQEAFEIAARWLGQPKAIKSEFEKVNAPMRPRLIKLAGVACVVVALFCPLCILLSMLVNPEINLVVKIFGLAAVAPAAAASVLGWRYNHGFLPVIRNQQLRAVVGSVCCVGCVIWIRFFLIHFPSEMPGGILPAAFLWGSGWTVMATLGGVGHGLEKAASEQDTAVGLLTSQS